MLAKCLHVIRVGAIPRWPAAVLMGTLAWCGRKGKRGTAGLVLAALPNCTSVPVLWCQHTSRQAVGWRNVAQPAETCWHVPG